MKICCKTNRRRCVRHQPTLGGPSKFEHAQTQQRFMEFQWRCAKHSGRVVRSPVATTSISSAVLQNHLTFVLLFQFLNGSPNARLIGKLRFGQQCSRTFCGTACVLAKSSDLWPSAKTGVAPRGVLQEAR